MSARQANCPNCGAGIGFRPGTAVSVCAFCSSVVARTDRELMLTGRVAALVDTHSPLSTGAEGVYQGSHFALVGRTQLAHPAGGVWDEWYLAFDDGRWGWLAEAQGRFYLTFRSNAGRSLPPLSSLEPGEDVNLGVAGRWVVQEVSEARVITAEGELPYYYRPDETYDFADVTGTKGGFATLDYSEDPPLLYLGREVNLADLKVQPRTGSTGGPSLQTAAINCPHCGGPLTLRAPGQTQRVTCPSCSSLLDADHGQLRYLKTLPPEKARIYLPPGTEGTLKGTKYTAIGYMRRSCTIEGIRYSWDEYLLYNPEVGFRWLTESDGHWNFVESVPAADVLCAGRTAIFGGKTYKKFQEVTATVDTVRGEFYWRVEVGEQVETADFVAPPYVLSEEVSTVSGPDSRKKVAPASKEINWSRGTWLPGKELWEGFKLAGEPPPAIGVASNQPSPYDRTFKQMLTLGGIFSVLVLALFILAAVTARREVVFLQEYKLPFTPDAKGEQVVFTEPFEIKDSRHTIAVRVSSNVSNSWIYLNGALVSEETGAIAQFDIENSYYFGVEGGERWSEGNPMATVYLSALPAGSYVMRLETQYDPKMTAPTFQIRVTTGEVRYLYALLALMVIGAGPLISLLARAAYENRRWQESMYSGG